MHITLTPLGKLFGVDRRCYSDNENGSITDVSQCGLQIMATLQRE